MSLKLSLVSNGRVAVLALENPPVNSLSHPARLALFEALEKMAADSSVLAVVLTGMGKVFSAGAEITEFGQPLAWPALKDLNAQLESFSKPVVALINGACLGGGLELAMCCHARISMPRATFALPEVKLGLLPGAGGTQRLPRLIGPVAALDLIASGRSIDAFAAKSLGLTDGEAGKGALADAAAFALRLAEGGDLPLAPSRRDELLEPVRRDRAAFDTLAENILSRARGLHAPVACVEAVSMSLDTPIEEALEREFQIFQRLEADPQSAAQRHLFFAERRAAKVEGVTIDDHPRIINSVAIIGAGTMGCGISMAFLNAGIPVTLLDLNAEGLDRGLETIRRNYDASVKRGSLSPLAREQRLALLTLSTEYETLRGVDLIIEAVFEDMAVKKRVFAALDQVARPDAVLATNTSFLDVNAIAEMISRPQDVVGLHFFSPANVMKLLEIVRGAKTSAAVLATVLELARRVGKVPVVVGVCHGFLGNRMLEARSSENESLLLEGATPKQVDAAFRSFGYPMGPFAMLDLSGLDIGWLNRQSLGQTALIADALYEAGRLGQKNGRGYFSYAADPRKGEADSEVLDIIERASAAAGITRRHVSNEEIIERTLFPMINEGARILDEGIAARASDIDVAWVNGYGFPVSLGGPMYWAEQTGLAHVLERIEAWHSRTGNPVFDPASLLRQLVAENRRFSEI